MKVVITGGAGFLGRMLAQAILARGTLTGPSGKQERVDEMVLFDASAGSSLPASLARAKLVLGDIAERAAIEALVDRPDLSLFHLASIVSAGGEQDFDLALRVNLDGSRHIFEALRRLGSRPRLVFTSSIAVFGPPAMGDAVDDLSKETPQTTYGMTKAIGELMVNDYTRKGFLDGRAARLPTIVVRPGKPNKAASSFASGVFREPLHGEACRLPVSLETVMPLAGYRTAIENMIRLHEAEGDRIGVDRAVGFPSLDVSVAEMIRGLKRVAGARPLGPIELAPDAEIQRIVAGWAGRTRWDKAQSLGLASDPDIDSIVRAYIEDFLQ